MSFPSASFQAAAPYLRRPFTPAAVKWKVQTQTPKERPTRGMIVPYIDARLVAERLNLVCPHLWTAAREPYGERIDSGLVVCHLTIDGLTRSDVGQGQGKAGWSDSLKRAAVLFGIGVSLYALRQVWLDVGKEGPTLRSTRSGLTIPPEADTWLRQKYATWLNSPAGKVFGPPLDHGDEEGSVGAALDTGEAAVEDEQPGVELAGARQEAEAAYQKATKEKAERRKSLPPGRFKAQLEATVSVEDVQQLVERVKGLK